MFGLHPCRQTVPFSVNYVANHVATSDDLLLWLFLKLALVAIQYNKKVITDRQNFSEFLQFQLWTPISLHQTIPQKSNLHNWNPQCMQIHMIEKYDKI